MLRTCSLLCLLLTGCGDKDTDSGADTADTATDTAADTDTEVTGEDLYMMHCSSCHDSDGTGVSGVAPNITNELGHTDAQLIGIILNGKEEMPAIDVTEEEAQLIVDYMRATWQ
jgi:mono/diheme cytochrome c family protein